MAILNRYKYIIVSVLMIICILSINVIKPKAELYDSINLVLNGDFNNGNTSWSYFVNANVINHFGEYCVQLYTTIDDVQIVRQFIDIKAGHKYYVSYYYKILSGSINNHGLRINNTYNNIYYVSLNDTTYDKWHKSSSILDVQENYDKIYLGQGNKTSIVNILYDKIMLIDLTTAYGAGNEPNILDCNSIYSEYFEGLKRQDIKPHDVTENAHKTVIGMIVSTMLVPINMLKEYKVGNQISLFDIFIGMIILFILTKTILKIGGRTSNDIR